MKLSKNSKDKTMKNLKMAALKWCSLNFS